MTEQTKAQRLADILQHKIPSIECLEQSAAELRRLDALVGELVEALKTCEYVNDCGFGHQEYDSIKVSVALAKAKEQT